MILVVDDYEDMCRVFVRLLKAKGFHAESVNSGAAALEKMSAKKPSLVILDVMMPGMTGIDVLEVMRSDPGLTDVPVVMFTASDDAQHKKKALSLGVIDFVFKSDVHYPTFLSNVAAYARPA